MDKALEELAELRLAAALAHCLPESRLELTSGDGEQVVAGFCEGCAITPCRLVVVVAAALRDGAPDGVCRALGLAGSRVRARLLGESLDDCHVGAGVFRYAADDAWGHVFATVLPGADTRRIVLERSARRLEVTEPDTRAVRACRWYLVPNDEIAVTICFSELPPVDPATAAAAERLAVDIAAGCVVEELLLAGTATT